LHQQCPGRQGLRPGLYLEGANPGEARERLTLRQQAGPPARSATVASTETSELIESLAKPLQLVLGSAERLLSDLELGRALDPDRLCAIRDNALKAAVVARSLMALSRTSGPASAKVFPFEILDRIVAAKAHDLMEARVGVTTTGDEGAAVVGDPELLEDALTRLVDSTTARIGRSGPADLRLKVSSSGGWVSVTAEDDVGHARNGVRQVPGTRAHNLSVCQDILVQYGGRMSVGTSPTGGSMVTLTLPEAGAVNSRRAGAAEHLRTAA
jgi:signal transduction histidine kinase